MISEQTAWQVGQLLGLDWDVVPLRWWTTGLNVELEHGKKWSHISQYTNVTNDDVLKTAGIALAHLIEFPDYYQRLHQMESQADLYWRQQLSKPFALATNSQIKFQVSRT